jgi:transcriptional regulator with XRE-family HTH domain
MSMKDKLKKITSEKTSDWLAKAEDALAHAGARRNARKVALRVLQALREQDINQADLAVKMGVSRQQVTKIVKGKENFTFETIDKLEKALGVTLISVAPTPQPALGHGTLIESTLTIPARSQIAEPYKGSRHVFISYSWFHSPALLAMFYSSIKKVSQDIVHKTTEQPLELSGSTVFFDVQAFTSDPITTTSNLVKEFKGADKKIVECWS